MSSAPRSAPKSAAEAALDADERTKLKGPPAPPFKTAKAEGMSKFPATAGGDNGTRALAALGATPTQVLMNAMMTIEQQVEIVSKINHGFAAAAGPFLQQMRDMAMATAADLAAGGTGTPNLGTAAAPPLMPGAAPAPGGPAGPGGPGIPPPPPPM
jgi:hypothetical protein